MRYIQSLTNRMINYNKPIRRAQIDSEAYEKKFKLCEEYLAGKKELLPKLLRDPTTFSYLFFKNNEGNRLKLYDYQDMILNDSYRFIYFRAANQIGKLLDDETPILTSSGWKRNGELKPGDYVYGKDGKQTKILKVFHHKDWQFYKLTFDDGSHIYAGAEHLWICKTNKERFRKIYKSRFKKWKNPTYGEWVIRRTDEIIKSGNYKPFAKSNYDKVSIPVTNPINIETYGNFIINPYLLGLFLGDGCLANYTAKFTTADKELINSFKDEYKIKQVGKNTDYTIYKFGKQLRTIGLTGCNSENKYIPEDYLLHSSIKERKELLRGLMDTDGTVYGKYSTLEYCTISKKLKNNFITLIQSLGCIINKITKRKPFYKDLYGNKVFGKDAYYIRFRSKFNPFKLRRKALKFKPCVAHRHERIIEKIEQAHIGNGTCIIVDNEDHSYLAGKDFIATHNSFLFNVKAARNLIIDHGHAHNEAIVSKSLPQSIFQMRRTKQILNSMKDVNWKDQKGTADSMSVITVDIKDDEDNTKYTNMLVCAPCTEGLLGYDLHDLNLDEFEYWDVDINHFFNQIAQPRTYTTKGNILIMSNPNGQDSFGAELEKQQLKNKDRKWHNYIFDYLDKPGNTKEEYDQLKSELTRQQFESTVAAKRSLSSKNFFTTEEIKKSRDKSLTEINMVGKQTFFFLDVGSKHDQSVLCGGYTEPDKENDKLNRIYIPLIHIYPVGYPISRVVGSDDGTKDDGWHYEKPVKEYLKEWSEGGIQPVFGVDVTGNSGISPLFDAVGINAEDITFSGPVKSGMYQRFKYFMEKGLLHRIPKEEFDYQASHLEMKKTARGYLSIHHEQESDLDDVMDSVAGLIHLADNPDYVPVTFKVI